MKKVIALSLISAAMVLATGINLKSGVNVQKEELDTRLIVTLKGDVNAKSQESIIRQQNAVIAQIREGITTDYRVSDRYSTLVNGFSIDINSSHVDEIRRLPNVRHVDYNKIHDVKFVDDGVVTESLEIAIKKKQENVSKSTMNVPDKTNEGEGVLIAILDTGYLLNGQTFDEEGNVAKTGVTHNAFTALKKGIKVHDTKESIQEKISLTKGFHGKNDASHSTYYNTKVPFFYDYGGESTERGKVGPEDFDVFTTASEHGTHVATIAAGNDNNYKGIAPKAQLALMKVFTVYTPTTADAAAGATTSTGAYDEAVLKAFEDCAILGVDVINMSLGSDLNDFEDDCAVRQAIKQLNEKGCFVDIAAGNEGKDTFDRSAYEFWTTDNVETGILSTYSNSPEAMTVGASQADKEFYTTALVIGNNTISFRDQVENYNSADGEVVYNPERHITDLLNDHPDGMFEWVKIGGWGESKDYEGKDVKGKIAIVDRGETTFVSKITAAQSEGAIAIGIIDNDPTNTDFTFRMDLSGWTPDIPVISILFRDKELIDNATDHTAKLLVNVEAENPTKGRMATFSSDGPTYNMAIKPEISTPGQSILGGILTDADAYDYFDGTSMATPNFAGVTALMISQNNTPEYRKTINDRLMSTANPLIDVKGENIASVRKQGAGMVDVKGAIESKVYLDGANSEALLGKAKIELGNNADIKEGNVKLAFTAINEGDNEIAYNAKVYVYRPDLAELDKENFPEFEGVKLQATYNHLIGTFEQSVTVKPGNNLISLNPYEIPNAEKQIINDNFPYGCYVEGYVVLEAEGQETLNIPYLGFYGNLEDAIPVEPFTFERDPNKTYASDVMNSVVEKWKGLQEADFASSWYAGYYAGFEDLDMSKVIQNENSFGDLVDANGNSVVPVGINPYTGTSNGKDIYVGNNGFTNTMIISQFVLRSVKNNTITITNKASNKVVLTDHMFDSLFGATEDEAEHDIAWPLFKSQVCTNLWSLSYIAHRAYTLIPLYAMDDSNNNLGNFPDGEYEMKFSYVTTDDKVFEKSYNLHIDSKMPTISKTEQISKDGESYYRVRFDEQFMSRYAVGGEYVEANKDDNGYYYDFKISDFANGYGFIESNDLSYAITKTLVKFDDPNGMSVSHNSFTMQHTFDYTETVDSETSRTYELSFKKNGKVAVIKGTFAISMKVPAGFDASKLMVYGVNNKGVETREYCVVKDGIASFQVNSTKFRLDASASNNLDYALESISAYYNSRELFVGDTFDASQVVVIGHYQCGIVEELTSGFTVDSSKVDLTKEGTYEVSVSYNGKSASFKVKVNLKVNEAVPELEDSPKVEVKQSKAGCGGEIVTMSTFIAFLGIGALMALASKKNRKEQ